MGKAKTLKPIIRMAVDPETDEDTAALTLFTKRDLNVETDRIQRNRTWQITGDKIYSVCLTNDARIIKCKSTAVDGAAG